MDRFEGIRADTTSAGSWVNPLRSDYFMLETALTPKECLDRLGQQVKSHYSRAVVYDCTLPLDGSVTDADFDISRCVFYKNVYRPWAKGKLLATGEGTVVSCRIGVGHLTMAGALLILVAFIAALSYLPSFAILQLGFLLWLGSVAVRLYLARGDRSFLMQLLSATLETHERVQPVVTATSVGALDARNLYRTLPGHRVSVWTRLAVGAVALLILWKIAVIAYTLWRYG